MIASHPLRLRPLVPLALAVCLAGCSSTDVSRSFGLTRDAPDEFSVTTRAPLSLPPDYAVRPPRPGATRPQEASTRAAAAATLAPQAVFAAPTTESAGEKALLSAAGPPAPADIRAKIDADSALASTDRSFADRLMFWRSPPPVGTVVDPQKEAQRLRENAALGQPQDVGDTPIIQRKSKGFFGIF